MPLVWTPDPATVPWHDVQADEVWTQGPIQATDDEALLTVSGYDCEVIGDPLAGLVIRADAGGVTASAPETLGLGAVFPPVDIEYQIAGVTGHCKSFDELPDEADEVIRFVPYPANTRDWTLRVTAHCAALTGATQDFTADFVLRVWADFDPGRDALKKAVDARRR
jgi:hypothetical protein